MAGDPGLPISLMFPCSPAPGARAVRHHVEIQADWSVHTGHDEALERIAAAMGGGATCIGALKAVVPGLRAWWQRAHRQSGLLVRSPDHGATWASTDGTHRCCPAGGLTDPALAAAHVRDVPHVAAVTGVPVRDLRAAVTGLGQPTRDRAGSLPGRVDDLTAQAWACGLDPVWVDDVRRALTGPDPGGAHQDAGLISHDLLLAIAQTGADPHWLARYRVDESARRWLAWTATDLDRAQQDARGRWLATGTRRSDIVALSEAGYQADTAVAVAHTWRMSIPGAAKLLARWSELGYRPTAAHFESVIDLGVGYLPGPPAVSAVERVARALGGTRSTVEQRTELAMALVRWGTVPDTVAMLRASHARGPGRGQGPGQGQRQGAGQGPQGDQRASA